MNLVKLPVSSQVMNRKKMTKLEQFETEYDDHGNRIHYMTKSNIHPEKNMEVWMEYDYSSKIVEVHCTKIIVED